MKTSVHITDNYIINPTNPLTVNLIGAGGTGSQMLTALARINYALLHLDHPGLSVTVYDDDRITEANIGRQLFSESEIGLHKSVTLVNRYNVFFGTNWKAKARRFGNDLYDIDSYRANIHISCVDTAKSRFEISELLYEMNLSKRYNRDQPLYWLDLGNSKDTGQAILSTIANIRQPESEKFTTVSNLPFITEMFRDELEQADKSDNTPSCSLAEALTQQDLFINPAIAILGGELLWQLFREGMIFNRGAFIHLKNFRTQPIKLS
ncbi:PRTRC system ThiF family protein [Mucilaginibacter corticis]|uniref:PRTRC system ThiF family protein n=1 Tax=Mucilaginibacter corticis TaxID=2597670 RepID=A0A556MLV7_9SPHI|nr:PRTRC system ThiF family protein [Mucilaginibacter corticis]TSJ40914.1 PRTRC system ThiF family protein [Mucilaginibacter corticis]